jgi:hypothetical protein
MFDLTKFRSHRLVKKTVAAVGALLAFSVLSLSSAQAAPIIVPAGLNPGDTFRLVFVTSTGRDATSSNIADYNAFVTAAANSQAALAALGTTWTAIASTATVNARDNTNTVPSGAGGSLGVPIYRLDGNQVVSSYDDLWDGTIDLPIAFDEAGNLAFDVNPEEGANVWTGTALDGTTDPIGALGTLLPRYGVTEFPTSGTWITAGTFSQNFDPRLYAISGIITVAEPGALSLMALGLVGLGVARRRAAKTRMSSMNLT